MTRLLPLLLPFLAIIAGCNRSTPPTKVKERNESNNQYKDFAWDGNNIWGLTTDGRLALFDPSTGAPIEEKVWNDSTIVAIANDREGNIVIVDKNGAIKKYDKQSESWITLFEVDNTVLAITFDSRNHCYLITSKGVYDNSTKEYFFPDSSHRHGLRHELGWLREPAYLTDRNDNIWIGFGYGEWGGSLFIFNTVGRKFVKPDLDGFLITLNPIKSIFESKENVFVSSGLMHFSTHGRIAKFTNFQSAIIFDSEEHRKFPDDSTNDEMVEGEYIGPGAYSEKDGSIYFYSQNGIFKGNSQGDLSKIENWTKVLQPKLRWTNGQPDAIGSPMNVLKLRFIDSDRLVFVSQNDGIGIYDGKKLVMMR